MILFLSVMCGLLLCACIYLVYLLNNREVDKNNNFIPDALERKTEETKADLQKLKDSLEIVAEDLYKFLS